VAVRTRARGPRASRSPAAALDVSSRPGTDLFFRLLLIAFPDQGVDRPRRHPARKGIHRRGTQCVSGHVSLLVCTHALLALLEQPHAHADLLAGSGSFAPGRVESVAARHSFCLFRVLSFLHYSSTGFRLLPVRRDVAGSGLHLPFLRATRIAAEIWRVASAIAGQSFPAALGMVPDLFRIGRRKARKRRLLLAAPDRHGRLLPERPVAHMGRLLRAAPAALVPCGDSHDDADCGTGPGFMLFLPRRWKIICFCIVTPFQVGIIITANYTFLNYLVLCLGFLLLDDRLLRAFIPQRWRADLDNPPVEHAKHSGEEERFARFAPRRWLKLTGAILAAWCLIAVFYVTTTGLLEILPVGNPFPEAPTRMLEPFRIANRYGLFAVMTHQRYEIEFQGSNDGKTWTPYPFRYKPQDPYKAPGIYAPYQPRFEWNLWFASLDNWRNNKWVVRTEERLLRNQPDVLVLFARNPFASAPPQKTRVVIWQYWFTTLEEKHRTGAWWNRKLLGEYAPGIEKTANGDLVFTSEEEEPQTDQR
jgi:hypothetical protein